MIVKEKKRIQVKTDRDLADDTETVLSELGLNPVAAVNMFYKQTVANGALSSDASLSEEERANLHLLKTTEGTLVTEFKGTKEAANQLNDPDKD